MCVLLSALSLSLSLSLCVCVCVCVLRCLFSTHYHALVEEGMESDECLHMECEENGEGGITFLYKLKQGVCKSSFGVNVARLAGIPDQVLKRADELINNSAQ